MNKNPVANLNEERAKDIAAMQDPKNVREEFRNLSLEECQEHCRQDRLPFDACFLNITSDLNVSTSVRTLHLMGASKVFILGKNKLDRRALVGAEFYSDIEKLGGLDPVSLEIDEKVFLELLARDENYFPIFVETNGESLQNIDWKGTLSKTDGTLYRPLLIFGNENRGIGENIFALRSQLVRSMVVSIPMKGVLRSLNVSASVAMITWDLVQSLFLTE